MSKVPKFHFEDQPPAKVAKPAKLESTEAITFATFAVDKSHKHLHPVTGGTHVNPEIHAVTCMACPWYELNPWTHYPNFAAWCHYMMEHLVVSCPACEKFRRGEVPPRQNHEPVPEVLPSTSPALPERVLTCYDCSHFEANHGPNPRQGWGKCLKRGHGRFGCATACGDVFTKEGLSNAHLKN
jgi:hypothetical protein